MKTLQKITLQIINMMIIIAGTSVIIYGILIFIQKSHAFGY